jgi:ribose-phosphate pyrophosphokinase
MSDMMLFTGNANPELAKSISNHLDLPLSKALVGRFSDGETMVEIMENVRGRDVFIIQPTCAPTNETLMELIIMADAIRRASASRITAVVTYYGYGRQDRRPRSARVPITAKLAASMIQLAGVDRVLTVDLHADQIQGFFDVPVDNVYATPEIFKSIEAENYDYNKVVVISPDVGGVVRARAVAKYLNDAGIAIIDKRRTGPNKAEAIHVVGDVVDKHCLIVDDIVDTAGTLCSAAQKLKEFGATGVSAYITHPVLSGKAIANINHSCIDKLVVTDTIPLTQAAQDCPKIRTISLAPMLAQAIRRINKEVSLSSMFGEHVT